MNSGGYYCPRCDKRVYFAEEVIAMGKHWHKTCFRCANSECKKRLDSLNCTEREGEAYCNICYKRFFGPKGYGFGIGSGTLSMESADGAIVTSNVSSYAQAQAAGGRHQPLTERNSARHSYSSSMNSDDSSSLRTPPLASPVSPVGVKFAPVGGDVCRRCGKTVYLAERMCCAGSYYHKMTCFNCTLCSKRLESTNLCEREDDIYCKTCYARNFGPKGYGFGVGAGTLQMQQ